MQIDTFIKLIQDLRTNQIADDVDPNNVVFQKYITPYDQTKVSDSVRFFKPTGSGALTWGDGSTYTATDSNGNTWQAPVCNWLWGAGGKWG